MDTLLILSERDSYIYILQIFKLLTTLHTTTKFHFLAASATVVQTVEHPARSMSLMGSL